MGLFGKKKQELSPPGKPQADARVKVLGSGCVSCNKLESNAQEAMKQLGFDPVVGHVTDFAQIAAYGVMRTPALMVDDRVLASGQVLSVQELVSLLGDHLTGGQ